MVGAQGPCKRRSACLSRMTAAGGRRKQEARADHEGRRVHAGPLGPALTAQRRLLADHIQAQVPRVVLILVLVQLTAAGACT